MARVLVIDDSETVLAYLAGALSTDGHDVVATSSGEWAVGHLASAPVDLVLTDLYMPAPDGFEIMRAARALARPTPVIAMSTNPPQCNVLRAARALGAAATLQKPFTVESLRGAISAVLARVPAAAAEPHCAASLPVVPTRAHA